MSSLWVSAFNLWDWILILGDTVRIVLNPRIPLIDFGKLVVGAGKKSTFTARNGAG